MNTLKVPILKEQLADLYPYKESRVRLATKFVQEGSIEDLIAYCHPSSPVSHKACWCLEQAYYLFPETCYPHMEKIFSLYTTQVNVSGMRCLLKIGFEVLKSYYGPRDHEVKQLITQEMKEQLVRASFDALINDSGRSANLMYATRSLYLMRNEFDLIPHQLPVFIERLIMDPENKGYRSCGREILTKLSWQKQA
ncbi:adenylosuccinate lyase [Nonlabens agnitus]|uniref:Adenylosuccinate lyase n=1 Tax=Nonlabens agnitus TaxID=870484 RepID=A0A2S9WS69_9FLAO|nr:adenylosuccinate lyase [Nonlabens agnitus]PRP66136.1 hypothetical protein BST86_03055 [Nonlabens agnitus]